MSETEENNPILCVDFDGVIHSYASGWKGEEEIPDDPVPGAFDFLWRCIRQDNFQVVIFSSRATPDGIIAMKRWFERHGAGDLFQLLRFHDKPPAVLTIDDRCWTFGGTFPTGREIAAFRPWNKR